MSIEVTSACQDSDCPTVIVWTKNGGTENSWQVWPQDGEIEPGNEVSASGEETECTRQPTNDERTAIQSAFADWKAIGNWDNDIPWMVRTLLKSPDGKARALEIAREADRKNRESK